jgi:small subunit ribosomal protein S20
MPESSRPRGPLLPLATILRPASAGVFTPKPMPNIRQQEKRVRQAAKERSSNLRWRSTSKTLMRRLKEAAEQGDATAVGERHRELVSWLDKAAARGGLHKNTAARRKAQAARLLAAKK